MPDVRQQLALLAPGRVELGGHRVEALGELAHLARPLEAAAGGAPCEGTSAVALGQAPERPRDRARQEPRDRRADEAAIRMTTGQQRGSTSRPAPRPTVRRRQDDRARPLAGPPR